jgi:hypothetical protein
MPEATPTPFTMHGARETIANGLDHIEQQAVALERAVMETPGLAFDVAKTLLESLCRRVLDHCGIAHSRTDDLPALFNKVKRSGLPFLPPAASGASEARRSLEQTISGRSTAIQGICGLRNQCGFASHGSGAPRPGMETAQALLAAEAADAMLGFLHRLHREDRAPPAPAAVPRHSEFDESLDEEVGPIKIHEAEFRASDVLFGLEPATDRIHAAEFGAHGEDADTAEESLP